ncbi:hypothetical protein [Streptomyces asiaticus]|uniref:hypothetical protein n=1 Tax=Streptomyces asiaticus TaxID=114695 RepID=UPI003F6627DF
MADETPNEQAEAPATKRRTRKPAAPKVDNPFVALDAAIQRAIQELGEYDANDSYASRRPAHERRANAWAKEYGKTGALDALLLSHTFEVLAAFPHEQHPALVQLAAVALNEAKKLETAR